MRNQGSAEVKSRIRRDQVKDSYANGIKDPKQRENNREPKWVIPKESRTRRGWNKDFQRLNQGSVRCYPSPSSLWQVFLGMILFTAPIMIVKERSFEKSYIAVNRISVSYAFGQLWVNYVIQQQLATTFTICSEAKEIDYKNVNTSTQIAPRIVHQSHPEIQASKRATYNFDFWLPHFTKLTNFLGLFIACG